MRKFLSFMLCFIAISSLFCLNFTASAAPEGIAINTAEEFMAMVSTPADASEPTARYYLASDIILSWTYKEPFWGILDGNGKTITVTNPIFDDFSGEVKNLTIKGEIYYTDADAAGFATTSSRGYKATKVTNNANVIVMGNAKHAGGFSARIENNELGDAVCYFYDCVNNGEIYVDSTANEKPRAGGFAGIIDCCYFYDCVNNGNVYVKGNTTCLGAGFVARAALNKGFNEATAFDCINNGNVKVVDSYIDRYGQTGMGTGNSEAGGIFAYLGGSGNAGWYKIWGCTNNGNIDGPYRVGGMAGYVYASGSTAFVDIQFCINAGNLSFGRIPGIKEGTIPYDYCGPFVGYTNSAFTTIKYCIDTGTITKHENALTANDGLTFVGLSSADGSQYDIKGVYVLNKEQYKWVTYASAESNAANCHPIAEAEGIFVTTLEEIKSGKVAYLINQEAKDDPYGWAGCDTDNPYYFYQKIGQDSFPTTDFTRGAVLYINGVYSNQDPATCTHPGTITEYQNIVEATCTVPGSQDVVVLCNTCAKEMSRTTVPLPASHSYEKTVVEPTVFSGGSTIYTCTVCFDSYSDNLLPPLEPTPGDVNGDGKNSILDAIYLYLYLAGKDVECVSAVLDANGDKIIDKNDAQIIAQGTAGNANVSMGDTCAHDLVFVPSAKETSNNHGYRIDHWSCRLCGMSFKGSDAKAAISTESVTIHSGSWVTEMPATKTTDGFKKLVCNVCGKVLERKVLYATGSEGLIFALNQDGESYSLINMGTCNDKDVHIPEYHNDLPVTIIAEDVFNEYTILESLYVPSTITAFKWSSFWNCQNFNKVMISDLAAWCNIRMNVYPLETARNLYLNGQLITDLVIPEGVNTINANAFYGASINTVVFPESLEKIYSSAFANTNIKNVIIPKNVNHIYGSAFSGCNLEQVIVVPENKTFVVVNNCLVKIAEKTVILGYGNCSIPNNGSVTTIGEEAFANNSVITEMIIPDGVTTICFGAFEDCENLGKVVIPDSVTSIGSYAFNWCVALTSIKLPDGITTITWGMFQSCRNLKSVYIPASVTTIEDYAFSYCTGITSFIYDGSTAQWEAVIKDEGWNQNCTFEVQFTVADDGHRHDQTVIAGKTPTCTESGLTEGIKCSVCGKIFIEQTVIPATGHTEGEWVVDKAPTKTEEGVKKSACTACGVEFTASIPWLGSEGLVFELSEDGTYYSLVGMGTCTDKELYIPSTYNGLPVTTIPWSALLADNLIEVHIPASIQEIFYSDWADSLQAVYITDLTAWCNIRFDYLYSNPLWKAEKLYLDGFLVTDLVIPDEVTKILNCAFSNATYIKSVVIHNAVTTICNYSFDGCSGITEISISKSVTRVDGNAFANCQNLQKITVDPQNPVYHSIDNCIVETARKVLVLGCKNSIIPTDGSVTMIGSGAFASRGGIKEIVIPAGVTEIHVSAFDHCYDLETITIPDSIYYISFCAFQGCQNLTIVFEGTPAAWEAIHKDNAWDNNCTYRVICTKGEDGHTHDQTVIAGKAPTCTESGLTEGIKCSICGKIFAEQTEIPATGHTEGEWIVTKEPTKTEEGSKHTNCTVCGVEFTASIPWLGSEGLEFALSEDGKYYSIVGMGTCTDTDLYIPSIYNNIPVTDIALSPEQCAGVESIHIPASITSVENFGVIMGRDEVYICDLAVWCNIESGRASYSSNHRYNLYLNGQLVTDLVIPEGITGINSNTFNLCMSIKSLTLPKSIEYINGNTLSGMVSLEVVNVDPADTRYYFTNGCLIDKENKSLVWCAANFVIPTDGSVTRIDDYAFYRNQNIESIVIPDMITSIGSSAFSSCYNLTSVTIPSSVTNIDRYAFAWNNNLKDFIFDGTRAEWEAITKGENWNADCTFEVQFMVAEDGHRHDQTVIAGKAPTCTESGLTEGIKCSVCGKIFAEQTEIPATGHTEGEWTVTKEPTKTEEGSKRTNCTSCGLEFTKYIQPIASEGLVYTLNKDGKSYSLTGMGTCTDVNVVIAGEYNGLPVTIIEGGIFNEYANLESLYIPSSIETLGWSQFWKFENFNKVMISDLSAWCAARHDASILSYAHNLYLNGELVTDLVIPEGVKTINYSAFYGASINTVVLPESLEKIGYDAFASTNISSVILPESLKTIGSDAFANTNIKNVIIPKNVEYISGNVYSGCELEQVIVVPENKMFVVVNNCLINIAEKTVVLGYGNCSIPNDGSITTIDRYAFANNLVITEMIIPDGVTTINYGAFEGCENLGKVVIPDTVTFIDNYAFNWCVALTIIKLPDGITTITWGMFQSCRNLKSVYIPASVTTIANNAFSYCTGITSFIYDGSAAQWEAVTKDEGWNQNCTFEVQFMVAEDEHRHDQTVIAGKAPTCTESGLSDGTKCSICGKIFFEQTEIPATGHVEGEWTVTKEPTKTEEGSKRTNCTSCGLEFTKYIQPIASEGLEYTLNSDGKSYSLTGMGTSTDVNVVIAGEYNGLPVTSIAEDVFNEYTILESLYIPSSIETLGWSQFWKFENFNKVMISDLSAWCAARHDASILSYAHNLYLNGELVTDLVFPEGVKTINYSAFYGASINTVVFPESLEKIYSSAFANTNIKNVIIPKNVNHIYGSAFSGCNLEQVIVVPENKTFVVVNNCLVKIAEKTVILGYGNCSIPNNGSVTTIGEEAFANNSVITEMIIPDGVTTICFGAFQDCENLVKVVMPDTAIHLGSCVFRGCSKLTSVNIPNGITTISWDMFRRCYNLNNVVVPASVTVIEELAFDYCTGITSFTFDGSAAQWEAVTKDERWNQNCAFEVQFTVADDGHKHDQTVIAGKAPTCTESGLTEGIKCSACGWVFLEQTIIEIVAHNIVNGVCEICKTAFAIPSEYVDATPGYITTEDTVITTKHLVFNVPKNVYVMDSFVEIVDIVTTTMEHVSGMKFEGNPNYCNFTGTATHANVEVVKPEGSECGPAYASNLEGAVISACDIVDLYALIHENAHVLHFRQSMWFFCTWAMEGISTYTTYKTAQYILENYPQLALIANTPNLCMNNHRISDYSKLYEHTMEYWIDNTFEYGGNQNYSIGFYFAWFLDEVYGDYTKWIYVYEESRPYHSFEGPNTLPADEQVKAFKMAYGENVFDEFYAWLKQNEYKFDYSDTTDFRAGDQINFYPQFMAEETYVIGEMLQYDDLCFDLTGGIYYLSVYQSKNIDDLILHIETENVETVLLFDAQGNYIRSQTIDFYADVDITGVYYIVLPGEGILRWFSISGF